MQLHVAVDQLPDNIAGKPIFGRVLRLMQQVVEEGRITLGGLRSSGSVSADLERAFSLVGQELAASKPVNFRVLVEGSARPLQPILRDEVYRIGREALTNAFLHARASSIELELEYAVDRLRVLVLDDGAGIDPDIMTSGRAGHFGLTGMRERAERIGAHFKVSSNGRRGTEVDLSVPGHLAFEPHTSTGRAK